MAHRSPRARRTPATRAARPPLGRALPLGSGVVLLAGLATYASLLRAATSAEIASVLAIGAAVVGVVVALTRPASTPRPGSYPLPVRADAPSAGRVDSAFVCTKCDTYSAPPDWEAMLKEFEPPRDLEGRGDEKPHLTPGAASVDAIWPRWPIATASAPAATAAALPVVEGGVAGRWSPTGWSLEQAPALLGSVSAVEPNAADDWSISGARRRSPGGPVSGTAAGDSGRPAAVEPLPGPSDNAPSPFLVAGFPSLEQWISTESAGLVARTPRTELTPPGGESAEGARRGHHCAYCRTEVEDLEQASRCTDCRRPVCGPCEESLLEHRGERFCSPCAVNRLGSDLLRTIEEPVSLGGSGAYARSGARRARPRRRAASGSRARTPRAPPSLESATPSPSDLPQPVIVAPEGRSPTGSSAGELPTKGIPDPVL